MNRTVGIISTNYSGSALKELVDKRTPASVPFGGRYRLIDFALSNLVNSGLRTVGLITPYYYRSLLGHVGAGKEWDLDRKDGGLMFLPGTVFGFQEDDSSFLFRDIVHNSEFLDRSDADYVLVTSANLVFNIDYKPMIDHHELAGRPITVLYKKLADNVRRPGTYFELDEKGKVTSITSDTASGNLFLEAFIINRGFLVRMVRDYKALGYMDMMTIFRKQMESFDIGSFAFTGYVGFTDTLEEYMRTSMEMLNSEYRHDVFRRDRPIATKAHDAPPALYVPGAKVTNSLVTVGCVIEGTVENSIVSRNAHIGKGASVKNCVLMDNANIGDGTVLENVICDKYVSISAGVRLQGDPVNPCVIGRGETV